MTKEFDLLVFIGRFAPLHNEHTRIIEIALQKSQHVLVLVGSAGKARTIRNPFTYQERKRFITGCFPSNFVDGKPSDTPLIGADRLFVRPLFDKTYNDAAWIKQVQDNVVSVAMDIANPTQAGKIFQTSGISHLKIGLIGASKDHTSYYLKMFPQWGSVDVKIENDINATDIREVLLRGTLTKEDASKILPYSVIDFLYHDFMGVLNPHDTVSRERSGFVDTTYFKTLQAELLFAEKYKKSWKAAPYPVKHVTTDAVVEQSGHILVVKRRSEPGKGLWALPGGHLNEFERLVDGMLRELDEETKIKVPEAVLRGSIVGHRTFDDPHRSTIGRIITQAFHIKLKDAVDLPKVKGRDDAIAAKWLPIAELSEDIFHDDHFHIINFFLGIS